MEKMSKNTGTTEEIDDDFFANDAIQESESDHGDDQLILDTSFISFLSNSRGMEEDENDLSVGEPTGSSTADLEDTSLASTNLDSAVEDHCSPLQEDWDDDIDENQSDLEQAPLTSKAPTYSRKENNNYHHHRERYNRPHSTRLISKRRQQSTPAAPAPVDLDQNPGTNTSSASNISEPVVVLGMDISSLSSTSQFLVCAGGVFLFNLSFGFLQEFVAVEICNRNLGLFLAMAQFSGYTILSYILRTYVNQNKEPSSTKTQAQIHSYPPVPTYMYLGLGAMSAIDMATTNMSLYYINFPAKTLMKSTRVVFTMIFGVLLAGKRYRLVDYTLVLCMVAGLGIFMQADASSSAIFEPMGIFMLTISLICDGATNILSEIIMKTYGVGQDELIFRMYSLALIAVAATALVNGDLHLGMAWLTKPGTYEEWKEGTSEDQVTWNALGKIIMIILFSSSGFFGSSCSAAITKYFGAFTMSMTSTARRAMTLFISFFMFDNECTFMHITGMSVFITAMTTKSLMGRSKGPKPKFPTPPPPRTMKDPELGKSTPPANSARTVSTAH